MTPCGSKIGRVVREHTIIPRPAQQPVRQPRREEERRKEEDPGILVENWPVPANWPQPVPTKERR